VDDGDREHVDDRDREHKRKLRGEEEE